MRRLRARSASEPRPGAKRRSCSCSRPCCGYWASRWIGRSGRSICSFSRSSTAGLSVCTRCWRLSRVQVLPGPGHVSLGSEISYQLASRQGTGSLLDVHSQTFAQARSWVELDPWLTLGGLAVVVAGLAIRRLRAIALAIAIQLAYMAKGGYVPYAYVTAIIPFAALLVPGVLDELWHHRSAGRAGQLLTRLPVVIAAIVFAVAVVPRWAGALHAQAGVNGFASEDAAVAWIARNVPARDIVVSDAYPWLDIKLRTRATPLYLWQIDDDPAVMHDLLPHGYKDISYLLLEPTSPLTFKALPDRPTLQAAIAHAVIVRRYGDIDIYKVRQSPLPPGQQECWRAPTSSARPAGPRRWSPGRGPRWPRPPPRRPGRGSGGPGWAANANPARSAAVTVSLMERRSSAVSTRPDHRHAGHGISVTGASLAAGGSDEAAGEAWNDWIASAAKRREAATRAAVDVARMPPLAMSMRIRSSWTKSGRSSRPPWPGGPARRSRAARTRGRRRNPSRWERPR